MKIKSGKRIKEITGASKFNGKQLYFIYDPQLLQEGAEEVLAALERGKNLPKEHDVYLSKVIVNPFYSIDFVGEYKCIGKTGDEGWSNCVSNISYDELIDIVGINGTDELNLIYIGDKEELEIKKIIMKNLGAIYQAHIL